MSPQTLDLIAALQRAIVESGVDLSADPCNEETMSTRDQSEDRPQPPLPMAGRGAVVACRTWNAEVVGSIPTAQTNTRTPG